MDLVKLCLVFFWGLLKLNLCPQFKQALENVKREKKLICDYLLILNVRWAKKQNETSQSNTHTRLYSVCKASILLIYLFNIMLFSRIIIAFYAYLQLLWKTRP